MSVRCPQTNLQIRIIKKKSLRGRKDFQCRYVYQYLILMLIIFVIHSMQNYVLCLKDLCGKTEMNVCVFFLIGNQTEVVRTGNEKK